MQLTLFKNKTRYHSTLGMRYSLGPKLKYLYYSWLEFQNTTGEQEFYFALYVCVFLFLCLQVHNCVRVLVCECFHMSQSQKINSDILTQELPIILGSKFFPWPRPHVANSLSQFMSPRDLLVLTSQNPQCSCEFCLWNSGSFIFKQTLH